MSSQSYEYAAKSVDSAIQEGLQQLGVTLDQVEVEILHEGSRGILGIGAIDARVRLTIKAMSAATDAHPTSSEATEAEPPSSASAEEPAKVDSSLDDSMPATQPTDEVENNTELADIAYDLLSQMLQHMGIHADIKVSWLDSPDESERLLNLNVVGGDLGVLIGRNGETLAHIQYLVRLMVNQELHRWTNIVVDVDGYKQRRSEQLIQLAQRLAEQVVVSGRPVALEPMPAGERRLVHIALRNHPDVYTESTGEDSRRKVQILLKS